APAERFRRGAGRQCQVGLAGARRPLEVEPAAGAGGQRLQLRDRARGRTHVGLEALVRRIAQRQRKLPAHASGRAGPAGAAGVAGAGAGAGAGAVATGAAPAPRSRGSPPATPTLTSTTGAAPAASAARPA